MQIFISGTDTNIGKTTIASWLCLQAGYDYFKPLQTGSNEQTDSQTVAGLIEGKVHKEAYVYSHPLSPHLAAKLQNEIIDVKRIQLPDSLNLIIEGAGGLMVPINQTVLMIDLIKQLNVPVLLVASSRLGTINHTLLSLEALRVRRIPILGVIVNGEANLPNCEAIEFYGKVTVVAQMPLLKEISAKALSQIPLGQQLREILGVAHVK